MARRLCAGNEADAEDLVQDTAVRAFRAFASLEDQGRARAWLFTILHRTHLNRERSRRRRPDQPAGDPPDRPLDELLAESAVREPRPDPALRLATARAIGEAFDALSRKLRPVVWLVDVEGFRIREVAEMLELPEGTVASRLHRGRQGLRANLDATGLRPGGASGLP